MLLPVTLSDIKNSVHAQRLLCPRPLPGVLGHSSTALVELWGSRSSEGTTERTSPELKKGSEPEPETLENVSCNERGGPEGPPLAYSSID